MTPGPAQSPVGDAAIDGTEPGGLWRVRLDWSEARTAWVRGTPEDDPLRVGAWSKTNDPARAKTFSRSEAEAVAARYDADPDVQRIAHVERVPTWPYFALYFGCWRGVGHGYYAPGMSSANYKTRSTELTPWGDGIDGRFTPKSTAEQGAALLTHADEWTILAVHDYTVDGRRGSHSTFAFYGVDLTYEQALSKAREWFPEVVRRIGEIKQVAS